MKDLQIRGNRRLNPLIMQQPCNRLCKYLRYQCVGSARRSVQPWANITILAIKKMCVGRIFRIGAMKAGTAWAQRTHCTTYPGGVSLPVHRRECLTYLYTGFLGDMPK